MSSIFSLSAVYWVGCTFLDLNVLEVALVWFTTLGFREEESAVPANQAHIAGHLCSHSVKMLVLLWLHWWARRACDWRGQCSSWVFPLFQGVHESKGVTEDYLKLESLIQKVVSPYLGTYGLYSSDGPFTHSACILGKNNTHSVWHSTEDFLKPCSMQGQGLHKRWLPVLT